MCILSAIFLMNWTTAAKSSSAPWMLVAIVISLLIVVALVALKFGVVLHRRGARWTEAAGELGLNYQPKADKAFRKDWSILPEVKKSGSIKHVLAGHVQDFEVTAFEHTLMVMVGHAPIVIRHCVYSTPAAGWPELHITPRGWWSRWRFKRGARQGLLVGDEEFDLGRVVKADTPEFARWLLGPEMRAFLLEADGETWRVVGEQLCMVRKQAMRPDSVAFSIDRLLGFWAAMPQGEEEAADAIGAASAV